VKSGRSFYTYARIPVGTATQELQALAEREYEEVGQKDLDRLNIDWARYGELDAAGKLATFIAKRNGVIVGYAAFIVQTHIHYQDALVAANSAVYAVPEVRAGRVVLKLLRFAEMALPESISESFTTSLMDDPEMLKCEQIDERTHVGP
jgi:hypothetical protein